MRIGGPVGALVCAAVWGLVAGAVGCDSDAVVDPAQDDAAVEPQKDATPEQQDALPPQQDAAPDGPSCDLGLTGTSAACDSCRFTYCCAEAAACRDDASCGTWLSCEDACAVDDAVCQSDCWRQHAAGREKSAYMACKQRSCAGVCSAAVCSEYYNYFDEPANDACRACRNEHCCDEEQACWEDVDCVDALECFESCPDLACMVSRCNDTEHLGYMTRLGPDWACRQRYCLAECAPGACSVVLNPGGECGSCWDANCCAESAACSSDAECLQYRTCRSQCDASPLGPLACMQDCAARYWMGGGLELPFMYCSMSNCRTACNYIAVQCGGLQRYYPSLMCRSCTETSCCAEAEACGTSAACGSMLLCAYGCAGDAACEAECAALAPAAGVTTYQALKACQATNCSLTCPST